MSHSDLLKEVTVCHYRINLRISARYFRRITVLRHPFFRKSHPKGLKAIWSRSLPHARLSFPLSPTTRSLESWITLATTHRHRLAKSCGRCLVGGLSPIPCSKWGSFFCQSRFSRMLNGGLLAEIAMRLCNLYRIYLCLLDTGLKK